MLGLFRNPEKAAPEDFRKALAKVDVAHEDAVLAELQAARNRAVLGEQPDAVIKVDSAIAEQRVKVEQALARREWLEEKVAELDAVYREAEKKAQYEAAKKAAADGRAACKELEPALKVALRVVKRIYDAEAAVYAANRSLPAGAKQISSPEMDARQPGWAKETYHSRARPLATELNIPALKWGEEELFYASRAVDAEPGAIAADVSARIAEVLK